MTDQKLDDYDGDIVVQSSNFDGNAVAIDCSGKRIELTPDDARRLQVDIEHILRDRGEDSLIGKADELLGGKLVELIEREYTPEG